MYNLVNTVLSPTRITKSTKSLLNIIITNKQTDTESSVVIDLGFSDHHAQVLSINIETPISKPLRVRKREFREYNIK
jgi:hypothetical protein